MGTKNTHPASDLSTSALKFGVRHVTIGQEEDPRAALERAGLKLHGWCNGTGMCGMCLVRVVGPEFPPPSSVDRKFLSAQELAAGIRLACTMPPGSYAMAFDERLMLHSTVLPPEEVMNPFFWPGRPGPGIGIDLGTSTIMVTVFDEFGKPGPVVRGPNPQARFGLDVLSRISAVLSFGSGQSLKELALDSMSRIVDLAVEAARAESAEWIAVVGNTVMHHLVAGLDVSSMAQLPFEPSAKARHYVGLPEIQPSCCSHCAVLTPPLGGFVGSDALASLLLLLDRMPEKTWLLVDLGTNCEVVLWSNGCAYYASAPAGPAFEGRGLSCGMEAGPGAVIRVSMERGRYSWRLAAGDELFGICGSGAIDFLAVLLDKGEVDESGRLNESRSQRFVPLDPDARVRLTQGDIRELQKAKGAVELGIRTVLEAARIGSEDLNAILVAGAFGGGIDIENAQRIGMIPRIDSERCLDAGNLALLGAGLTLQEEKVESCRERTRRISLQGEANLERFTNALSLRPWS